MNILVVEDEKKIASFIRKGLKSEGYNVEIAYDGEVGFSLSQQDKYDLLILDIMLPKLDGLTLCRKLRTLGNSVPIIMLTAKDSVEDRVGGLYAGADDYLTKPFSFAELVARIRALSRRHGAVDTKKMKLADLEVNPESYEISRAGKEIKLSATEFKLLTYLMQNENKVLSKIQILEHVWGYDFDPESNIVEVYIKYLRDKIDKGFKKSLVQTLHG
jgi:two-component system, OmpR family, copper resistance phosphate regulon response regulator CusR